MNPRIKDVAGILRYIKAGKSFNYAIDKVKFLSVGDGKCSAELKIDDEHVNSMGTLHGGLSATLVDCITSFALMTKISCQHVSVDMHVSYVKGARKGEDVLVNASVRRIGKAIVFSEARITDKKTGDLLVEGLHTQYLLRDKCC
ncbi:hypothetical protein MTP99_005481 [Tenebrio molitor]|nr:hypothetical protein MTP99_005481 [Tenebrio molitor]